MTIVRVQKKEANYVVLDKTSLNDDRLSWKAKGIHAYLIGKPDGWQVYVKDLAKRSTDGRDACASGLKELEKFGYLKRFRLRKDDGTIDRWESVVYEIPIAETPQTGFPELDKPELDKPFLNNIYIETNTNSNDQRPKGVGIGVEKLSALPLGGIPAYASPSNGDIGFERQASPIVTIKRLEELYGQKITAALKRRISQFPEESDYALSGIEERLTNGEAIESVPAAFTAQFKTVAPLAFGDSAAAVKKARKGTSKTTNTQSQADDTESLTGSLKVADAERLLRAYDYTVDNQLKPMDELYLVERSEKSGIVRLKSSLVYFVQYRFERDEQTLAYCRSKKHFEDPANMTITSDAAVRDMNSAKFFARPKDS